jgi:hypothetical protein
MEEAYHRYFAEAFDTLPRQLDSPLDWLEDRWGLEREQAENAVSRISDAVEAADLSLRETSSHVLRADAKWLLLLAFSQLMVQAVVAVRQESPEELFVQAEHDVMHVAKFALENAVEREISSHGVIDALSSQWGQLELTRAAWWEPT